MLNFLKNHPFAVEAHFDSSLVLTYALPVERLAPLIPECLTIDTFHDQWGFVAVAMVQTQALRPAGLPAFVGQDFFLIGYRVFVRFMDRTGRSLRGLYILRSATDRKRMEVFGNLFTHYDYRTIDVDIKETGEAREIVSDASDLVVEYVPPRDGINVPLPDGSPFATWQEARKFAGPLPFTFTYNAAKREVLIIEGVRENWRPAPVQVTKAHIGFLDELSLGDAVLANAFLVRNIPYRWEKGRVEKWRP